MLGVQCKVGEVWRGCWALRQDRALVPGNVEPHGDGLLSLAVGQDAVQGEGSLEESLC